MGTVSTNLSKQKELTKKTEAVKNARDKSANDIEGPFPSGSFFQLLMD